MHVCSPVLWLLSDTELQPYKTQLLITKDSPYSAVLHLPDSACRQLSM